MVHWQWQMPRRLGQAVRVSPEFLRFELRKPTVGWGLRIAESATGGIPQGVGKFSEVAYHNSNGDRRVVEAQERAPVIEQEFRSMDTPEWWERYGIPLAFVNGMKVEVEPFRSVIWRGVRHKLRLHREGGSRGCPWSPGLGRGCRCLGLPE